MTSSSQDGGTVPHAMMSGGVSDFQQNLKVAANATATTMTTTTAATTLPPNITYGDVLVTPTSLMNLTENKQNPKTEERLVELAKQENSILAELRDLERNLLQSEGDLLRACGPYGSIMTGFAPMKNLLKYPAVRINHLFLAKKRKLMVANESNCLLSNSSITAPTKLNRRKARRCVITHHDQQQQQQQQQIQQAQMMQMREQQLAQQQQIWMQQQQMQQGSSFPASEGDDGDGSYEETGVAQNNNGDPEGGEENDKKLPTYLITVKEQDAHVLCVD
eukprot:Platyproteum_vivax@DN14626_c0_g1_i1.p1